MQLTATDATTLIRADAFGVALAYASSSQSLGNATTGAASIGVAAAVNDVTGSVYGRRRRFCRHERQRLDHSGHVQFPLSSRPLAIGIAASLANGTGTTEALSAGRSAGTGNTIKEDDEAYIRNGGKGVTSRSGSVSVTASDGSKITANAGGFGIGLAFGSDGNAIGATIGISAATNDVENQVLA